MKTRDNKTDEPAAESACARSTSGPDAIRAFAGSCFQLPITNSQMNDSEIKKLGNWSETGWTRFAWFGVVAGTSAWMLGTGLFLIANRQFFAGTFPLVSGLSSLVVGMLTWSLRGRIAVNRALMMLLAVTLVTTSIAVPCTINFAPSEILARMKWPTNPIPLVLFLILVLGGGIWQNHTIQRR